MQLKEIIERAKRELQNAMNLEVSTISGASKVEDGWQVTLELIERKAIPDTQDLLGSYEVHLDDAGDMMSFERKKVRRRMDTEETE
ncbi:gas vesicle protein [Candidatus Aerophobetes bacterium]|nr:gas vesicle protein [Candidatus Aerophobetes bacterium]